MDKTGKIIKQELKRIGMSQGKLAEICKMTEPGFVSMMKNNSYKFDTMLKISETFERSLDFLAGKVDDGHLSAIREEIEDLREQLKRQKEINAILFKTIGDLSGISPSKYAGLSEADKSPFENDQQEKSA